MKDIEQKGVDATCLCGEIFHSCNGNPCYDAWETSFPPYEILWAKLINVNGWINLDASGISMDDFLDRLDDGATTE